MRRIKIIKIPETELDMFSKHGVKTIVMGKKKIKLTKVKKNEPNKERPNDLE